MFDKNIETKKRQFYRIWHNKTKERLKKEIESLIIKYGVIEDLLSEKGVIINCDE